MTNSPLDRAAAAFASELARWRAERAMSKRELATRMGFDPSYVSHVENRRHRPTADFARRAESVLRAGGAIWHRYRDYEQVRGAPAAGAAELPVQRWLPPGIGLVVERETATLRHGPYGWVHHVRRDLYNAHSEPVTRCPIRIMVDRWPGEPERSRAFHRENPLTWPSLNLTARCGDEPMLWRPAHDWDAVKEAWLLFENENARFPLYPGQRASIEYEYRVDADLMGPAFQRSIRLPTRELLLRLDFPRSVRARVWGSESTLTAESIPLRTAVAHRRDGDRDIFEWATLDPTLHARYRLEWLFRAAPRSTGGNPSRQGEPPAGVPEPDRAGAPEVIGATNHNGHPVGGPAGEPGGAGARRAVHEYRHSGERMRAAGIVQRDQPQLHRPADPVVLPAEADMVRDVVDRLVRTLERTGRLHAGEPAGLTAPQIGTGRAVAVLAGPEVGGVLALINPRVVGASGQSVERYEGCLSFPDVRGLVARPVWVEVEHTTMDGHRVATRFLHAVARLVAHQVDHLEGRLYPDRMAPGIPLIPAGTRRGIGRPQI